jgi:RimJ/RimL family protein N-acetyltransferase
MMDVSIRPIVADDNELLLRWRSDPRNARWFFSGVVPTPYSQAEWFEQYCSRQDEILYVIEREGVGPIGTVGLSGIGSHHAEVGRVLIGDPRFRGRGYAYAALVALEEIAVEHHLIERLSLEVLEDNEPARRLYERCGFTQVGTRVVLMDEVAHSAIVMAKELEAVHVAS